MPEDQGDLFRLIWYEDNDIDRGVTVVSLHEYTGLLKNNNIYSQNLLSQKTTVLKYNAIS